MTETILYHFNHPKGKPLSSLRKFSTDDELVEQGWTQDPDKVTAPVAKVTEFTDEQVEEASPDVLVGMVKALGYTVLTDIEIQAMKNKSDSAPADITEITDDALRAELDRRNGNKTAAMVDSLAERFRTEPTELNKEELVVYGKEAFGIKLTMTMKEETLIGKINEAILAAQ